MIAEDLGIKLENVNVQMLGNANEHAGTYGGKMWRYVLVPRDELWRFRRSSA